MIISSILSLGSSPLLQTLIAGALTLVLPGWLVLSLLTGPGRLTLLERIAYGFAISWCAITLLCVAAFVFGRSVADASIALLGLDAVLAVVFAVKSRARTVTPLDRRQWLLLIGIVLVSLAYYRIGGYSDPANGPVVAKSDWSTMEELLQISSVRKIADAPQLRVAEVMYAKGEISTYFYPVYPFALALVGTVARLDPLVLFDSFRLWSVALGLISVLVLALTAFGPTVGGWTAVVALVLVATGNAGQAAGFGSWAQLAPLVHQGDFALGVLLPLSLAAVIRFVDARPGDRLFAWLIVPLLWAMTLTHTREAVHVASYMSAFLLVGPLTGALDRRRWIRLAAVVAGVAVFMLGYSTIIKTVVPFIGEHELASAARARLDYAALAHGGRLLTFSTSKVPHVLAPFVSLAFLVAPSLLIVCRRSTGVVFLASGLLLWFLPLHSPFVASILERLIYSEIMTSPARYVFHVGYLIFGAGVYWASTFIYRLFSGPINTGAIKVGSQIRTAPGERSLVLDVALSAVDGATGGLVIEIGRGSDDQSPDSSSSQRYLDVPLFLNTLLLLLFAAAIGFGLYQLVWHPAWVPLTALLLGVIASRWQARFAQVPAPPPSRGTRSAAVVVSLALLGGFLYFLLAPTDAAVVRTLPRTRHVERWYEQAKLSTTLPLSAVRLLRSAIPPRSVIATDPVLGLSIPAAVDQFIFVSGTNFTTDLHYLETVDRLAHVVFDPERDIDWASYRARLGDDLSRFRDDILLWEGYYYKQKRLYTLGISTQYPIFSENEPNELTLQYLDALAPEFLLLAPAQHPRLAALVAAHADRFVPVANDDGYFVYRVSGAGAR